MAAQATGAPGIGGGDCMTTREFEKAQLRLDIDQMQRDMGEEAATLVKQDEYYRKLMQDYFERRD